VDKNSNFSKNNTKTITSLLTFFIIWSSVFSLIISAGTVDFIFNGPAPVFAQGNQTEVEDSQKQNESLINDKSTKEKESLNPIVKDTDKDKVNEESSQQQQDTKDDNDKPQIGIITDPVPIDNCGINPNAPPCCTPGKDKGCIGDKKGGPIPGIMGPVGGGTTHPAPEVEEFEILVPYKCLSYDVSFDWDGDHVITLPAKTCIQIREYPSTPKIVALFAQQWLQGNKVYDNSFSNAPCINPPQRGCIYPPVILYAPSGWWCNLETCI